MVDAEGKAKLDMECPELWNYKRAWLSLKKSMFLIRHSISQTACNWTDKGLSPDSYPLEWLTDLLLECKSAETYTQDCCWFLGLLILKLYRDFPGGPVVKTLCFQCRRRYRFDPWLGNWNPTCQSVKKKKQDPSEVNEPRAYYAKWSKSERERQILYINGYIWNLERGYW